MDIRLETALIIRKDGKYLVGKSIVTGLLVWRESPWDAWKTRVRADAMSIADKTGSDIYLWNPVVGQLRRFTNE